MPTVPTPAGIFSSIALAYSRFNIRSTEDGTHPLWNAVLIHLCQGNLDRLLPTPQYRIWAFKAYSSNHTTSAPPGSVFEVIPDFVIILTILEFRLERLPWLQRYRPGRNEETPPMERPSSMSSFLDGLRSLVFPMWIAVRVKGVVIPVLTELKKPISRHPDSPHAQVTEIIEQLDAAKIQVALQAKCLFKSDLYLGQKEVMVIAATADFWTFRWVARPPPEEYRGLKRAYASLLQEEEKDFKGEPGIEDSDSEYVDEGSDGSDLEEEEGKKATSKKKKEKVRVSEAEEQREPSIYPLEDLSAQLDIIAGQAVDGFPMKSLGLAHLGKGDRPDFQKTHEWFDGWSPIFRIGTEGSGDAFAYISGELKRLVADNGYD
ncbi:hypothetical protein DFP72DRAFT_828906 [Ephemerocybe angulata]|uniref:Uncharacterized protein n=1 Tax=Ephemerocybe angulata TaxID=980116 RepID=A0A8H6HBN5_9AGAR|nr:hypothetical protein DFP72DRAFT_828906 [Tulosesus angulatus]